jgi:hypothetical protein
MDSAEWKSSFEEASGKFSENHGGGMKW